MKDLERAHPVATAWRPVLREIVHGLASRAAGPEPLGVEGVSGEVGTQIARYLEAYGEPLGALPDETWETSAAQWLGEHWEVLVDLWTIASGRSDLVLAVRVDEEGERPRFTVVGVYVP